METRTSNKVSMIALTLNHCANHAPITGTIPAFAGVKTTADNKLVLINQLGLIADSGTSGVTLNTKLVRETMCNIALKCGDAVSAFASSINDFDLRERVTFTLPLLNRMKKAEVTNICQVIHDEANTHIATAGAYGYTGTDVTDLQTAINLYHTDWQNPRQALIAKRDAIATIKQIVREVIDELFKNQMDKMVNTLRITQPSFVNQYYFSREIIDLGSTTAKVRGTVKKENGVPLANVLFVIYQTGTTTIVKQVVTDALGKFNAAQLPAGDYDLKWELYGYKTITENNVHISAGKELKRTIEMQPGGVSLTLSGNVAAGAVDNLAAVTNTVILPESTMRLAVTESTLRFYAAASNTAQPGVEYFDVAPGQIYNKTVTEWISLFGFDLELEDFLNVKNIGAVTGHWEMKFENLGA